MKYIKRNSDGSLGEVVETPWNQETMTPEMQTLYETLVYMDMEMTSMRSEYDEKIATLKAELEALKGGDS